MTTRKFSAIKLPHPKYALEIGCLSVKEEKGLNRLPTWIPRYSDLAQVIEVKRSGFDPTFGVCSTGSKTKTSTGQQQRKDITSNLIGSYITIDNARPELFLRRDFISQFVLRGTIYLVQDCSNSLASSSSPLLTWSSYSAKQRDYNYSIYSSNNVLTLVMGEKLYRRFGLIGKKLAATPGGSIGGGGAQKKSGTHRYRVRVDLKDKRIMDSNKYQDKLVEIFRRLNPINKLYFRFVPSKPTGLTLSEGNDNSFEFFRYVIDEYAIDGMQPVPLTNCSKVNHKLQRKWTNRSQCHPDLDLVTAMGVSSSALHKGSCVKVATGKGGDNSDVDRRNGEILDRVVDIIDWLGYQLLSLDCDNIEELRSKYLMEQTLTARSSGGSISDGGIGEYRAGNSYNANSHERFDVHCSQIQGVMDIERIQENLNDLFLTFNDCDDEEDDPARRGLVFRALFLYNTQDATNSGVVLMKDYHQVINQSNKSSKLSPSRLASSGNTQVNNKCDDVNDNTGSMITVIGMSSREMG